MNKLYLLLLCCIVLFKANGQPGSLDSTFGNNGIQTTAFLGNVNLLNEYGSKVLTSANGDLFVVVLGSGYFDFFHYYRISKYSSNGILDSTYGNGGYSDVVNFSVAGAALQGDKILVVGSALARYTADGVLDSSFGEKGIVTNVSGNSIALQGEKILVAGSTPNSGNGTADFALSRYTVDGTLDSSFGENGKVTTDFNFDDRANSIAIQGDKIIVAGSSNSDFALARYTADGTLDTSFGENGKVTTDFSDSSDDFARSIALQDDKIIVCGTVYGNDAYSDIALVRYTADGMLDFSFGDNGKVITDFGFDEDDAYSMALQGDKIVVAGSSYTHPGTEYNTDFVLVRYSADGATDASFGLNGVVTGYIPSSKTFFTSTAIQGDKIIAAGYAFQDNSNDFVLARYMADGNLDASFGVNGKVTTDFNGYNDYATSIALQGDKIIVVGYTGNYPNRDFAIARYFADGTLDSSFGENGKVTTDFNFDDRANSIAIQGDKIIVAGSSNSDFALARYTADGSLDSAFGVNGKVTTDFNGSVDYARSIAFQEGNIIVVGSSDSHIVLTRYTPDGILDFTFGENGRVITDLDNFYDYYGSSIALQGDKIVVSGEYQFGGFSLARYTADGMLDSSFGENGIATTSFNNAQDVANSIALQGDKIILAGYTHNFGDFATNDFALVRYTSNGILDSTFGENGKVVTTLGDINLGASGLLQAIALHQNRLYAVGSLSFYRDVTEETYGVVAAYQLEAPQPALTVSIADVTVQESKKLAVVTVRLSAPATKWVRVHFTTRNITAVRNQDYIGISGPLLFIPHLNTTAKIIIPIVDDNASEGAEQFEILLSNAHNATIEDSVGVVTIMDNDDALITKQQSTSLHIHVSPNPSTDGFTVQLQSSNLKQPVSVRLYDVSGRLIEERNNIAIGQSLRLGDQYKAGTYIIEAVQGSRSVQTKVVKTGQ